ncbi:MAG: hypothetical protein J5674_03805 [Candidatus Methanomethylophilaceae archaeon]|nr:hypothetical protein [Candidatus Methanomethylophilaceae archaeon]
MSSLNLLADATHFLRKAGRDASALSHILSAKRESIGSMTMDTSAAPIIDV